MASCDGRQIFIWDFVRFSHPLPSDKPAQRQEQSPILGPLSSESPPDEVWRIKSKMVETHSELLDLCWCGDDRVVTGGLLGISIWNIEDRSKVTSYGLLTS